MVSNTEYIMKPQIAQCLTFNMKPTHIILHICDTFNMKRYVKVAFSLEPMGGHILINTNIFYLKVAHLVNIKKTTYKYRIRIF